MLLNTCEINAVVQLAFFSKQETLFKYFQALQFVFLCGTDPHPWNNEGNSHKIADGINAVTFFFLWEKKNLQKKWKKKEEKLLKGLWDFEGSNQMWSKKLKWYIFSYRVQSVHVTVKLNEMCNKI